MLPPLPRCSGWASSSLVSPNRVSLPRFHVRIGLHIVLFEACLAFTCVAACTLARSPYIVTAIRRLQTLRLLHACSGRFRLELSPGGAEIDRVWCTPCVARQRCCRCQEHVHRIRRSFADRWSTSSVLDVILTSSPASLSQAATPFARGSPRLTETRAAGRRRLLV